jgi:O-antigen/teichoic acid export membrane protein
MSRALVEFSIPAVIGNLMLGGALWYGTYLLSRSATGFDDVALASAAQQWRGPVLFLNSSLATVAIPLMSRPDESEGGDAHRIHTLNIWSNLAIAFASCAVIALASTPILMAYAPSFIEHRWAFLLIVASVIGQSHVQILFQWLTSMRRLWRVLYYQMLFIIPFAVGYALVIPEWGLMGFALLTFAIWTAAGIVLHALISARILRERRLL